MEQYAQSLFDAIDAAIEPWITRCLAGTRVSHHDADRVVAEVRRFVRKELGELLELDVDAQRTNPLAILRAATRFPTALLKSHDALPAVRDEFHRSSFPDDVYGLAPATWADVDPSVVEAGITWGAWKASVVLTRRRR